MGEHFPPAKYPMEVDQPKPSEADSTRTPRHARVAAETLTTTHVFERLHVKGCGDEVMAFIRHGSATRQRSLGDDSAEAVTAEDSALTMLGENEGLWLSDGENVIPSEGEDSTPSEDAWRIAKLINVTLPNAEVEVINRDKDREGTRYVLSVDELRPINKVKEVHVTIHPSLQAECGTALDGYDYELCALSVADAIARCMLLRAHVASISSVEHVRVYKLSEKRQVAIHPTGASAGGFQKGQFGPGASVSRAFAKGF